MYLMHRISHENEAALKLLEEENLLSIGFAGKEFVSLLVDSGFVFSNEIFERK